MINFMMGFFGLIGLNLVSLASASDSIYTDSGLLKFEGLSRELVLRKLYEGASLQEGTFHDHNYYQIILSNDIENIENNKWKVESLKGRVLYLDLSANVINTHLYNKYNGPKKAEHIIKSLYDMKKIAEECYQRRATSKFITDYAPSITSFCVILLGLAAVQVAVYKWK